MIPTFSELREGLGGRRTTHRRDSPDRAPVPGVDPLGFTIPPRRWAQTLRGSARSLSLLGPSTMCVPFSQSQARTAMDATNARSCATADSNKWHFFITIVDPEVCSASSFGRLVTRALKYVPCPFVTMTGLQVIPGVPAEMQAASGRWPLLTIDALHAVLPSLVQFVEGEFFFLSRPELTQDEDKLVSLLEMRDRSELSISIHDNTCFGVVTRSPEVACDLLKGERPMLIEKRVGWSLSA